MTIPPAPKGSGARTWPSIKGQFKALDARDPSQWPTLPRGMLCLVVSLGVVGAVWGAVLSSFDAELLTEQAREVQLKNDLRQKLRQVARQGGLSQQVHQLESHITQIEQQLTHKDGVEALLADINQAGVRRGLQFELFRPGPEVFSAHHAEWPLALRVAGRYHDIAAFAADLSRLSSIVTLHQFSLSPSKSRPAWLILECTAKLVRQLDSAERAVQPTALETKP